VCGSVSIDSSRITGSLPTRAACCPVSPSTKNVRAWHREVWERSSGKQIACKFSRPKGSSTDSVVHVDSGEQKKDRDGCYMNERYGGFPQGVLVDWEDHGPFRVWAAFGDRRVAFVSP
jgi:hypothetical protein